MTRARRRYCVNIGRRNRYFATLEGARKACNAVFARTKIVLSIVQVDEIDVNDKALSPYSYEVKSTVVGGNS